MENQCYPHGPHWELSKKEVKNVFHYEESNLEKTIMEKSTLSSRTALRQYIHNYESTRTKSCPCVGSRTPRKVKKIDTILTDGINTTMKNTYVARLSREVPQYSNKKKIK